MSHSAAAAHGHDDHAADHGTVKSYIIGFVLSLLLTFGSFGLVMSGALSHTITIIGVVALCVLQLLVQLVQPELPAERPAERPAEPQRTQP